VPDTETGDSNHPGENDVREERKHKKAIRLLNGAVLRSTISRNCRTDDSERSRFRPEPEFPREKFRLLFHVLCRKEPPGTLIEVDVKTLFDVHGSSGIDSTLQYVDFDRIDIGTQIENRLSDFVWFGKRAQYASKFQKVRLDLLQNLHGVLPHLWLLRWMDLPDLDFKMPGRNAIHRPPKAFPGVESCYSRQPIVDQRPDGQDHKCADHDTFLDASVVYHK